MASITNLLAAIGVVLLLPQVYRFLNFLWLYFLRPSSVREYLHAPPAYALVTGASDGIGKALAKELYDKGFHLILHGRNETKMRAVADEIRARGTRNVLYFIADASDAGHDYARMMEPYTDLNITLVVHNVGGSGWHHEKMDAFSENDLVQIIQRNAVFPLLLTRTLLPHLRRTAKQGPVLVQFIGSQAADISPPRFALYAASKSFLRALARGLDNDERVWGTPSGVKFEYLAVGQVQSNSVRTPATLVCPTSERFAKAMVSRMGCGLRRYAPYMPHAVMQWAIELMGEKMVDHYTAQAIEQLITEQEKNA
ncbi:NAD(P)-binding protein [Laetiporus sulphureus 93-53]|uniref:NAD(P)-binding protein n=1 Tax=Laetiporus sulphureus 93-53 TaxID=1314785 RepID=A0A165E7X6_9APHY|nr:NAD(P)-binding protein [Laetiporus sulphureus 93-53]KZT06414.1 NAD(P)-binding protein [Laetiporus sulphureus 93-53]